MGEYRTTRGEAPPPTARERRHWFWRSLFTTIIVLAIVGFAGAKLKMNRYASATGYVTTAEYAEIRPPFAGIVTEIGRESGARIEPGEVLVKLDTTAAQAAYFDVLIKRNVAKADLLLAQSAVEKEKRAIEQATGSADSTSSMNIKSMDERLELLAENVRLRNDEVKLAKAMLDACEIKAPIGGRLLRHTFYKGETVRPDMLLAEIFGGKNLLLKLRVPERYATRVAVGQTVRIQLRSNRRLVSSWVKGTLIEARDIIQTDGPQAFRVVICKIDATAGTIPPGATADAQIMIGRSSFWASLFGL